MWAGCPEDSPRLRSMGPSPAPDLEATVHLRATLILWFSEATWEQNEFSDVLDICEISQSSRHDIQGSCHVKRFIFSFFLLTCLAEAHAHDTLAL